MDTANGTINHREIRARGRGSRGGRGSAKGHAKKNPLQVSEAAGSICDKMEGGGRRVSALIAKVRCQGEGDENPVKIRSCIKRLHPFASYTLCILYKA